MVGFPSLVLAATVSYGYNSWFTGVFGTGVGVALSIVAFLVVFNTTKNMLAEIRD